MATEITVEEAQANLERKRKEVGIEPSIPLTSKKSSGILENILSIIPKECSEHNLPLPCSECRREEKEMQNREEEWERKHEAESRANVDRILANQKEHPEKLLGSIGVSQRYRLCSFDNYKGGNKVKEVCRSFVNDGPFDLVLSGGPGSGKTHLAVAILRELIREGDITDEETGYSSQHMWHRVGYSGLFVSVPELLAKIRATYGKSEQSEQDIINKYARIDYLVLDDLGAEKSTEWSISTLYLIIDRRYRGEYPTIVTTNLTMDEIGQSLSPRIASRIGSGKVITIKAPDYRMKRGA